MSDAQKDTATPKAETRAETRAVTKPKAEPKLKPESKAEPQASSDVLVVTALRPRRRAGHAFGPTPVRIPLDTLTEEQRKAIEDDTILAAHVESAAAE